MSQLAILLIAAIRTAVGCLAFLAPGTALSLASHPSPSDNSSLVLNRLWGSRDAALGVLLYCSTSNEAIHGALVTSLAVDVLDLITVAIGLFDGSLRLRTAALMGGGVVVVFGLGVYALTGLGIKGAASPQGEDSRSLLNEN